MLKKLGIFILLLLGIGTSLTLYLPKPVISEPPLTRFVVIEETLKTPIEEMQLRHSYAVFQNQAEKTIEYGLQLGIYNNLVNAEKAAIGLDQQALPLPSVPVIFKVQNKKRHWFVMALGPFKTEDALPDLKQLLEKNHMNSQDISWPVIQQEE